MAPIVPLVDALAFVGVAADADEATTVAGLLNAISDEVRRLSRRALEGSATEYDQVLRIRGAHDFVLPEIPVDAEEDLVITPVDFDGTELDAIEVDQYRLEDAERGQISIIPTLERARITWSTTGVIADSLRQAVLEWLKDRFDNRDRARDLASYQTGQDAESYFATLAGKAPTSLGRALGLVWNGQAVVI